MTTCASCACLALISAPCCATGSAVFTHQQRPLPSRQPTCWLSDGCDARRQALQPAACGCGRARNDQERACLPTHQQPASAARQCWQRAAGPRCGGFLPLGRPTQHQQPAARASAQPSHVLGQVQLCDALLVCSACSTKCAVSPRAMRSATALIYGIIVQVPRPARRCAGCSVGGWSGGSAARGGSLSRDAQSAGHVCAASESARVHAGRPSLLRRHGVHPRELLLLFKLYRVP